MSKKLLKEGQMYLQFYCNDCQSRFIINKHTNKRVGQEYDSRTDTWKPKLRYRIRPQSYEGYSELDKTILGIEEAGIVIRNEHQQSFLSILRKEV